MISFKQLIKDLLANIASSLWFIPHGANPLDKFRGVKLKKFNSFFGRNVLIDDKYPQNIFISRDTIIELMSFILAHSFTPNGNKVVCENEIVKNFFISKGVIDCNSILLQATNLGDYFYVGAESLVSGIFLLDSLIVGNPVRITRKLKIINESLL